MFRLVTRFLYDFHMTFSYDLKMNTLQKQVIESNLEKLIEAFTPLNFTSFVGDLMVDKVIRIREYEELDQYSTTELKLIMLFDQLKGKDHGWNAILKFLKKTKENDALVKILFKAAMGTEIFTQSSFFTEIKNRLIIYYNDYCRIQTAFGKQRSIEEVWVPLEIDGIAESASQPTVCDHIKVLELMIKSDSPSIALVKGDPGMGKTTLVKRIVKDWTLAKETDSHFALVLAVPLRSVNKLIDNSATILEITTDYYAEVFSLLGDKKTELLIWLQDLGQKLLICLDGLDEYGSLAQSIFKDIFATTFEEQRTDSTPPPPLSPGFKLLITSRPYVCEIIIHPEVHPLIFVIPPMNADYVAEFVKRYCRSDKGKSEVNRYLGINADLIIRVPFVIVTICCWPEESEEIIPTNLTLLYKIICETLMAKRKIKGERTTVIESTSRLAFEGCKSHKFEFDESSWKECGVTEDSFTCGFLIRKFKFSQNGATAEFPHRFIQEFFAASYCYHLIETDIRTNGNSVFKKLLNSRGRLGRFFFGISLFETHRDLIIKQILNDESQFGRFFFGSCTDGKAFKEILQWLNLTFGDAEIFRFDFGLYLDVLSANLADCPEAKLLGQTLTTSLDQLERQITANRSREKIRADCLAFFYPGSFHKSFQSGLNLDFHSHTGFNFNIPHFDDPEQCRLCFIFEKPQVNLQKKFKKIHILSWLWGSDGLLNMMRALERFPPVSTLIVKMLHAEFEVNFEIEYKRTVDFDDVPQLRHFIFGICITDGLPDLEHYFSMDHEFSSALDFETEDIIADSRHTDIRWTKIRVNCSLDQFDLVKILMRSATRICRLAIGRGSMLR